MKRILLSFIIGIILGNLIYGSFVSDDNIQYAIGGIEKASPQDWIAEEDIKVYSSGVFVELEDARLAKFADTNSMDPLFDQGANAIEIIPKTSDEIKVGDIVAYEYDDMLVVHRVVEINEDEQGIYFIMKGDNNSTNDPDKIRFDQIKRVVVAVIY